MIVFGHGSVLAAGLFLLGALIYRDWITPEDGHFIREALAAAYQSYGLGFVVIIAGAVGFVIMHERLWLFLVRGKDAEIQRLVAERDRLQEVILKNRKSTVPGTKKGSAKRK